MGSSITKRVGQNLGMRLAAIALAAAFGAAPLAIGACSFDAVGAGAPAISDDAFAGDAIVDTGLRPDSGARDSGIDSADASDANDASTTTKDTGAVTPDASIPDAGHDSSAPDSGSHSGGHDADLG